MRVLLPFILCISMLLYNTGFSQSASDSRLTVIVMNSQQEGLEGAVVEIRDSATKKLVRSAITDKKGFALVTIPIAAHYILNTSYLSYDPYSSSLNKELLLAGKITITLLASTQTLSNVNVTSKKPFIQQAHGKVILNVDASITNTGTTILEVLEKSPGVTVDKDGGISLQGKAGVLVLIDDKPTFLSGSDLANLLGGMSSSQVDQVELITSPSAKYDASGNAGIINIKTKKNKQVGFNGVLTSAYGQGRYPKINNSLVINYRNGRFNSFLTYSGNYNKGYVDLYALRRYSDKAGSLTALLDQPTLFKNENFSNTLKAGLDFYASSKTTVGFVITGITVNKRGSSDAFASWKKNNGITDSSINTTSITSGQFNNLGINFNAKHNISKVQDLTFDADLLKYDIPNNQFFNSTLQSVGGYSQSSRGALPSALHIFSVKADYHLETGNHSKFESGYKLSGTHTDNIADYQYYDSLQWKPDSDKSNHFLYRESIHALYASFKQKFSAISYQLGLRFEDTHYDANQLGNSSHKDSAFSNNYNGFFPSGYITYQLDSANTFSFTAGRRIDRPAYQKLNPFVTIINKYTYSRGSPFLLPQYSWNMELSHQYKQMLTTTLSFSIINNYFSQLFLSEGTDILVYTNGNVGKMYNLGLSVAAQLAPFKWWSISTNAIFNHKELKGYQNINYASEVSQLNINMNNQFHLGPVYTCEISGFYTTKSRNDLQELLSPTGQLSAGLARPVLKKKGTLKISVRDIFYTQAMEGNTNFPNATEYFILRRDSRIINIAFTWRFGKPLKATRRNAGGAGDEIQRVGSGA